MYQLKGWTSIPSHSTCKRPPSKDCIIMYSAHCDTWYICLHNVNFDHMQREHDDPTVLSFTSLNCLQLNINILLMTQKLAKQLTAIINNSSLERKELISLTPHWINFSAPEGILGYIYHWHDPWSMIHCRHTYREKVTTWNNTLELSVSIGIFGMFKFKTIFTSNIWA